MHEIIRLTGAMVDLYCASYARPPTRIKTQAAQAPGKRRINYGALLVHLPRIHAMVVPADTNCPCCPGPMHVIGEEASERIDVIPVQYRVSVTHRPRLARRACERVVEAPALEYLIKSGHQAAVQLGTCASSRRTRWLILTRRGREANSISS